MKIVLGCTLLLVAACAVTERTLQQAAAPQFNYATLSDAVAALDVTNLTTLEAAVKVSHTHVVSLPNWCRCRILHSLMSAEYCSCSSMLWPGSCQLFNKMVLGVFAAVALRQHLKWPGPARELR
jgi:hypothetical protein